MLQVNEAQDQMVNAVQKTPIISLPLEEAIGKVIAAPHPTLRVLPPWDNSAMDGFALIHEDTKSAAGETPVYLQIVSEMSAGDPLQKIPQLHSGQAVRIMTGAPIPAGADAVVIKEKTNVQASRAGEQLLLSSPVKKHANIRFAGEDVAQGAMVAQPGMRLTPARLSLLASAGYADVNVHQAPRVAIIASGSELVPLGETPAAHQIVNSNAHAVGAALRSAGAQVRLVGIAEDTLKAHTDLLQASLDADLVVTIGGVSMGEKDWVRPALDKVGAKTIFWKIAMRPGKPLVFASREQQLIVGLPGNPVSALVGTELFLKPMVRQFMGMKQVFPRFLWASLSDSKPLKKRADFATFFRAQMHVAKEGVQVKVLRKQSSGQISGLADADALIMTPVGPTEIEPGSFVKVLPLSDVLFVSSDSLKPE